MNSLEKKQCNLSSRCSLLNAQTSVINMEGFSLLEFINMELSNSGVAFVSGRLSQLAMVIIICEKREKSEGDGKRRSG